MSAPDRIFASVTPARDGWYNNITIKGGQCSFGVTEYLRATPARRHADELAEALRNCLRQLDDLKAEGERVIEYGEEDPFRMGEWFGNEVAEEIDAARAALAKLEAET